MHSIKILAVLVGLVPSVARACDVAMLTDGVDRIKKAGGPNGFDMAKACARLIQNPSDLDAAATFILLYGAAYGKDAKRADAEKNCTPAQRAAAC